jgi:GT2 family glycosyltransferase
METENTVRYSIIIPTVGAADNLKHCLTALRDQDLDPSRFEVIVVRDGGPGESVSASPGEPKIPAIFLGQGHKGPAAARNLGIKNARGDIILFLDDDSVPTKTWAQAILEAWISYPESAGIGGYTLSEGTDSFCCRVNSDLFNWYLGRHSFDDHATFLSTCNAGYRKGILDGVGRFDERFKKASGEDRDLSLRILKTGGKLRLDKNILIYHDRDLTFGSFFRKHYNYGAAAFELSLIHRRLERLSLKDYALFYTSILKKYAKTSQKGLVFLLLTISQLATFLGYQAAKFFRRKPPAKNGPRTS